MSFAVTIRSDGYNLSYDSNPAMKEATQSRRQICRKLDSIQIPFAYLEDSLDAASLILGASDTLTKHADNDTELTSFTTLPIWSAGADYNHIQ